MKKLFAILSTILVLASCSENKLSELSEENQQNQNISSPVNFNITVDKMGTKALKTSWATGDVIYIMFRDIKTKYLTITYNGSTWTAQAYDGTNAATTFDVADFSPVTWKISTAVHFPVAVDASLNSETGVLTFQKDGDDVKTYYLWQTGADYTLDGANVNLTLSLQKPFNTVMFHIPGIQGNVDDYKLYITKESDNLDYSTWRSINSGNPSYEDIINAAVDGFQGVADADGALFAAFVFNGIGLGEAQNYTFTVKSPVQQYTISGSLTLNAGYQYSLPALNDAKWALGFREYFHPFSVSSTKTVYISPGNLQYQASTDTWRFAEHQWDYVGNAAGNTTTGDDRATQADWIDLFAWGTSGYDDPSSDHDVYYHPWDNTESSNYGPGNVSGFKISGDNLTGDLTKYDWGVYNAIGAYPAGTWRTLTADEWQWLLTPKTGDPDPGTNCRTSSTVNGVENARYAKASVNGINGLIIFPDSYTHPGGVTPPSGINTEDAAYTVNTYTAADWSAIQAAGAIFLPAAGYRYWNKGSDYRINGNNTYGRYWTRTCGSNNGNAQCIRIDDSSVRTYEDRSRWTSISVRLVHDID